MFQQGLTNELSHGTIIVRRIATAEIWW